MSSQWRDDEENGRLAKPKVQHEPKNLGIDTPPGLSWWHYNVLQTYTDTVLSCFSCSTTLSCRSQQLPPAEVEKLFTKDFMGQEIFRNSRAVALRKIRERFYKICWRGQFRRVGWVGWVLKWFQSEFEMPKGKGNLLARHSMCPAFTSALAAKGHGQTSGGRWSVLFSTTFKIFRVLSGTKL